MPHQWQSYTDLRHWTYRIMTLETFLPSLGTRQVLGDINKEIHGHLCLTYSLCMIVVNYSVDKLVVYS